MNFATTAIQLTQRHIGAIILMLTVAAVGFILLASPEGIAGNNQPAPVISAKDRQFLISAAQAGNAEIIASRVAPGNADSDAVKKFAAEMLDSHTKLAERLKQLAASKDVQLPDQPSRQQLTAIEKISGLNTKKYDRAYVALAGVAEHKDAVDLFRDASQTLIDDDIREFAAASLPMLKHHLLMAQDLQLSVGLP
ncbi:DUF4142 domain-containing protein [Undibacterium sp. TJN25]|uniref:DUF4142 domain-containing protein n=1 Tax=Undibacterium sp. TJN25 TaxID=3413056 RepID=UPI003BF18B47